MVTPSARTRNEDRHHTARLRIAVVPGSERVPLYGARSCRKLPEPRSTAGDDFLRDLQFAQQLNFPTLDITVDRERAGQFGLTMADVVHSVVPATSSSRFTAPPGSPRCG